MTEEEKKEIIRQAVHLMVKFQIENRNIKLDCVNREFVDKWLDLKENTQDGV